MSNTSTGADEHLINFVEKQLNAGKTIIRIPSWMLDDVSKEVIQEVRRLCKLNGAEIEIES